MRGALEAAVRASVREPRDGAYAGAWAGLAAGLAVGAPVAQVFLYFGTELGESLTLSLCLGGLAFACTAAGTLLAIQARTLGKAIAWVFASNVVPPTLVCAPTVVGLFFSVPSGLLAALVVLPLVLSVRAWAKDERSGRRERELLLGAALLGVSAYCLIGWQLYYRAEVEHPTPASSLSWTSVVATAIAALALSSWALARDVRRIWLARRVARGEDRALRLAASDALSVTIEEVADTGAGPHRSATTSATLGELPRSFARTLFALALSALAVLALVAC